MSRKYALINNNTVTNILDLEENEINQHAFNQLIIDVDSAVPAPQVGWVLQGNKLVSSGLQYETIEKQLAEKIRLARNFGDTLRWEVTDMLGARNILTGKTESEILTMASQLTPIGMLLSGGALRTSRSTLAAVKSSYPLHEDIFDYAISRLTDYVGN